MASKKKNIAQAMGPIKVLRSREATKKANPLYNGFACGYGVHGDTKYNRAKEKRAWKKAFG